MVDFYSTVRRKGGLNAHLMGGETVMASLEQGAYYALDSVGGRIWELVDRPIAVSRLLEMLQQEFEVPAETCRKDTLAFLNQLHAAGLLELAGTDAEERR